MTTLTAAQAAEQAAAQAAKRVARIDLLWCQAHVPAGTQSREIANYLNAWTCRECGTTATHKPMVTPAEMSRLMFRAMFDHEPKTGAETALAVPRRSYRKPGRS